MQIRDELVHENDLVGFVSTGTSAIEINPTYDFGHRRFNEAIDKVMGGGMSINEIIQSAPFESLSGPPGLRHDAHVAFKTAYEMLLQLGQINDRRKSFIYVSSGYTFDPFRDGRYARIQQRYQEVQDTPTEFYDEQGNDINRPINSAYDVDTPLADQNYMQKTEFLESDLISELAQITREARRNNVVFYALDPRGTDGNDSHRCARPADLQRLARLHHDAEQFAADALGRDRRVCDHPDQRLHEGTAADRRRDQRLLHHRLHVDEPRSIQGPSRRSRLK